MTSREDAVRVLSRALDQTGDVLDRVRPDQLDAATPCRDWQLQQLVDHVVTDPANLLAWLRGEDVDWSASSGVTSGWAEAFRERADDLVHAWHQLGEAEAPVEPDMATAEFAVHTWDLARTLGIDPATLDPEVAERGLAFMRATLKPEMRGGAFDDERQAPAGAGPYDVLAAFSGREV